METLFFDKIWNFFKFSSLINSWSVFCKTRTTWCFLYLWVTRDLQQISSIFLVLLFISSEIFKSFFWINKFRILGTPKVEDGGVWRSAEPWAPRSYSMIYLHCFIHVNDDFFLSSLESSSSYLNQRIYLSANKWWNETCSIWNHLLYWFHRTSLTKEY